MLIRYLWTKNTNSNCICVHWPDAHHSQVAGSAGNGQERQRNVPHLLALQRAVRASPHPGRYQGVPDAAHPAGERRHCAAAGEVQGECVTKCEVREVMDEVKKNVWIFLFWYSLLKIKGILKKRWNKIMFSLKWRYI